MRSVVLVLVVCLLGEGCTTLTADPVLTQAVISGAVQIATVIIQQKGKK